MLILYIYIIYIYIYVYCILNRPCLSSCGTKHRLMWSIPVGICNDFVLIVIANPFINILDLCKCTNMGWWIIHIQTLQKLGIVRRLTTEINPNTLLMHRFGYSPGTSPYMHAAAVKLHSTKKECRFAVCVPPCTPRT